MSMSFIPYVYKIQNWSVSAGQYETKHNHFKLYFFYNHKWITIC